MIDEVAILATDVDDARAVLAACHMFLSARDLMDAQVEFRGVRPSPLTEEVLRVKTKFDNYLSDYFLAQHDSEAEEYEEEPEEDSEEVTEDEALPTLPLGQFNAPKQVGRRLSVEELGEDDG